MDRKIIAVLLVLTVIMVVGISYSVLNGPTTQPSTPTTSCKMEDVTGNFTSSPQMNSTSTGPYNVTFYLQNNASQSVTITQYSDNNGFTQSVNWSVPAYTTGAFQTTIYKTENSLFLNTLCGTTVNTSLYYPIIFSNVKHYAITLSVSMGNAAT